MSANALTPDETRERLEEIQDELIELLKEANTLTGRAGERTWYANAICCITRDHDYMDRSYCLQDAIDKIDRLDSEEDAAGEHFEGGAYDRQRRGLE